MPALRKILLNGYVIMITSSVEEGLPFAPNSLINTILESCLARAQYHHPITICHYLFSGNHFHMIAIIENPNDIVGFMERFKTESAHAINKLLGKQKRTIWCDGYDSPLLLGEKEVIREISYLYTNPAKDNLESSIEKYPGINSWKDYQAKKHEKTCAYIRRSDIEPLPTPYPTLAHFNRLAANYKEQSRGSHTLTIKPNAWMKLFGIVDEQEVNETNQTIVDLVRTEELACEAVRNAINSKVIGAHRLMTRSIDTPYIPKRDGKKMWCICGDIAYRKYFISILKALAEKARAVFRAWQNGDTSQKFPPGLFPPCMPKLAEILPAAAFYEE